MINIALTRSNFAVLFLFITVNILANNKDGEDYYENDNSYKSVIVDINKDGVPDKVLYSKPYEGDELIFFINRNDVYHKELETINFSEDGGRIIKEVVKGSGEDNVLIVKTYFPDRGTYTTDFYIDFKNKDWILTKSKIETINWQEDPSKTKVCVIKQNLLLRELTGDNNMSILNEYEANDSLKSYYNKYKFSVDLKQYASQISYKKKTELIDTERYQQLFDTYPLSSNVTIYNNIAYYLEKKGIYKESIFILEKLIKKFPQRTVAYINLGDAYWGLEDKDNANQAYQKYIELMKASGKECKIPQRVYDRIKE